MVAGSGVLSLTKLKPTALEAGFVPLVAAGNLLLGSEDRLAAGWTEVGPLGPLHHHDGLWGRTED